MNTKIFCFWLGGWFTWWAVGTAVVGAVGSYTSSQKAKKAAGKTAAYENVDLQQQQRDALAGNISSQSSIEQLLERANSFQQDQAISLTDKAMPGYSDLAKSLTSRAQGMTDNPYDVPKEVEDNLARIAAERGISAGTRGQFNDFSLLRDFGVNSLTYGRENINQAQSITSMLAGIAPRVNPMSPLSFYVTPQQNAANTTNNNQTNQAIQQGSINASAAANNAANANTWSSLTQIAGAYAGSQTGKTSGVGQPTTYDQFIKNNPSSSAARG